MARRRNRRSHSSHRNFTLPIAPIAGLGVGMVPVFQNLARGQLTNAWAWMARNYTGFTGAETSSPHFDIAGLKDGAAPLAAGIIVHWLASRFGVNRALARAGVPVIRV